MASKKIIAVCQSGGDFVTSGDGSLTYTGGEAFAVDIDDKTLLSDFKQEVAEMFDCNATTLNIKYFLPGNRRTLITVSKDKDFTRMVNFVGDSNSIDVFIITEMAPARNLMPCSRSSRTTESEAQPIIPLASDEDPIDMNVANETRVDGISPRWNQRLGHVQEHWDDTITGVGQRFASFDEFREALHKFSLANCFSYKYKKRDNQRVTVKCKIEECKWQIYASKLATTQIVCIKRMVADHTCEGSAARNGYRATRSWVGNIIKEKMKACPNYKPKDIVDEIRKEYGIELNYSQAWRMKELAKEQLQGSYKEAYSQLPFYCQRIMETNPGSVATFTTKEDSSFHRLFISFNASLTGFQQGCRPLLFLDSTPLNTKYQGDLLAVVASDGDDGMFPLAFAVVDTVGETNWHWFLQELKTAISLPQAITFVADFQNGLKESIATIFTDGYHGYCLRYLTEKLNEDLKGQFSHEARRLMVDDLYSAAYAPRLEDFQRCIENIKAISPEAYNWVIQSEPRQWANAVFEGVRYNLIESNFGKLFFNWVSEANDQPITQMIDLLRGKMMELIYQRRTQCDEWSTKLTLSKEEQLQKEILKAQNLEVLPSHGSIFNVVHGHFSTAVDVDNWMCSCKEWELTGLPCCHAVAVINYIGKDPYDYCSRYFTVDFYRLTYAEWIHPIPNVEKATTAEEEQSSVVITPPPNKRPPGRPKLKHVEPVDLSKRQLQCSKCKGLGHNKKTCKNSIDS